ncbi:potassium channel family protein [Sphingomonas chungangi]|nr:potassium channel protein [Sphingomonas chungangi]
MRHTLTQEGVLGSPVRNLVSILVFVGTVIVVATIAYMAAGWSFADAIYMVLLTVYTVGYGEVRPIDTPYLHAVTVGTMVLGCTGMILLTSALVQFMTVMQLRQLLSPNRMQAKVDKLSDHVIVCGYGRIGVMLARDLAQGGLPLVVLERSTDRLAEAEAAGHLALPGDATDEQALVVAGIHRARALATVLPDDAANVFITLSARNLAPGIEIIARGEAPTTESKLRHAGADQVVLPTHIGAERIARMLLYPESRAARDEAGLHRAEQALDGVGLSLESVTIAPQSAAADATVADIERRGAGAFLIARIQREGADMAGRPGSDEIVHAGDRVTVVARNPVAAARVLLAPRGEIRVGRNTY